MRNRRWTIVLAAGAGRRLSTITGDVPKQFWREGGRRSLLEDTADRFVPLTPLSRTVVIVDDRHRNHVATTAPVYRDGGTSWIFQPQDRGTAAGVLFALLPVLDADPDALVTITPADHGVRDEEAFRRGLLEGEQHVLSHGLIVLFGVEPTSARDDYGWIMPGQAVASSKLPTVASFVEKPSRDVAERLLENGAVWNTMVVVARASALHALYAEHLPELVEVFDHARKSPWDERVAFLRLTYPALPKFDFSHDLLTPAQNLSTYVWPLDMGWSDLGTPERLREWHARGDIVLSTDAFSAA